MKIKNLILSFLLLPVITVPVFAGTSIDRTFNDNIRRGEGKIVISNSDPSVDVSSGVVDDQESVNVSGVATAGVETTITDIWDLTASSQLWIAPTQARIHQLVSSSDLDGKTSAVISIPTGTTTVTIADDTTLDTGAIVINFVVLRGASS
jgi:hypothetical protein